jgi:hypothetical protein
MASRNNKVLIKELLLEIKLPYETYSTSLEIIKWENVKQAHNKG